MKHQYLIVQPEIGQESYYFAPISAVIFGIHLITCMCDSFFFFFPKVPFFLFIIFTVYTMLPFGMRGAVIISVVSALSHIIVLSTVVSVTSQENKESFLFQVRKQFGYTMKYPSHVTLCFWHNYSVKKSSRLPH